MNKVLIVGQGFVGGSLATVLVERGVVVFSHDKRGLTALGSKKVVLSLDLKQEVEKTSYLQQVVVTVEEEKDFSGVFFVAVPTPMNTDGSADLSIVESVVADIAIAPNPRNLQRSIVIKSTIPPGTTEKFNEKYGSKQCGIVFNPEFLREATAIEDMRNQDRIVLGGPHPHVNIVRDLYKVAFPTVPIFKTSSTNAELIKYVTNCFLASKVSFANEIYQLCDALANKGLNVDYDRVIELATLDKRLGASHWQVPGPMPANDDSNKLLFGFSGSCFVKDINALIFIMKQLNIDPKMLSAAWEKNLEVRPQRDWENLVGRAVSSKKDE
jgi:UDPglucose 6-dehydrogenase